MSRATPELIMEAAEQLLVSEASIDDVSVRRIAALAGVNVAAVNYHFGSREKLIVAVIKRIYDRLNRERLGLLQTAIDAASPRAPELAAVLAALIAPSVRWSFDPQSGYSAFTHFAVLGQRSRNPEIRQALAEHVEHLRVFVPVLRQIAPWLSNGEIGWRIHCALGVRHNALRYRNRAEVLIDGSFDINDPDELLGRMIDVIAPMFERPPTRRPVSP